MTRTTMRTLLRKRIQEDSADQWSDANLNDLLNIGLQYIQEAVMQVDPMAFVYISRANIVNAQEYYDIPTDMWYEIRLGKLNSATSKYERLERRDYSLFDGDLPGTTGQAGRDTGSSLVYARYGRWFALNPIPTANQTSGLEVRYVPMLTMATDSEVPIVSVALHDGIVWHAKVVALGETGEPGQEAAQRRDEVLAKVPTYYRKSGRDNERLIPNIIKVY